MAQNQESVRRPKLGDNGFHLIPISSLRRNEQYANLTPLLSKEQFYNLKEDIRLRGIQIPIIATRDLEILDGHHRIRAQTEIAGENGGYNPDFKVPVKLQSILEGLDIREFILDANVNRRLPNLAQKAMMALTVC